MEWKELGIEDKELIESYTKNKFNESDYNFTNLFLWSKSEKIKFKIENEILIISGIFEGQEYYFMPIPPNENGKVLVKWKSIIKKLFEEKKDIILIPEYWKNKLEDTFLFREVRSRFDYVYNTVDLACLKGRKYSKKKNKINNFIRKYNYTYEKITAENLRDVITFQEEWYKTKKEEEKLILKNENLGIENMFVNFENLNLRGGLVRVEDKVVAYSLGEKISDDFGVIHIEKGMTEYVGSYQMINQLMVENEFLDCKFINREDDFGDDGLRKAKESYYPVMFLKKYEIVKNKEVIQCVK